VFEALLEAWDGEETVVRFDAPTRTWMFVCVHSTVLGPGAGGTRMKVYEDPQDALHDGLRLSSAMTRKNAVAGLPLGGGKGVLGVPEVPQGTARRELLLRYADLVESLHGSYWTACDMNTSPEDMDVIGERCRSVFGRTEAAGGSGSSATSTALGVYHGIRAAVPFAFGEDSLEGRTVLIQGVGAVGRILAEQLASDGARLIVSDIDDVRARGTADAVGADVFSPCATGGVLSAETIPGLRCRIVAGAANNQLETPEDAERFAEHGILYAPDYVVNAGGIIQLASLEMLDEDEAKRDARVEGIASTLADVLERAAREGVSTGTAAEHMAAERLGSVP
jgi:glutamate dehydrogenase/leucine dehydrogenase